MENIGYFRKDWDGHYYFIPSNIIKIFDQMRSNLIGKYYIDDQEDYDKFAQEFDKYKIKKDPYFYEVEIVKPLLDKIEQNHSSRMRLHVPSSSQLDSIVENLQLSGYDYHYGEGDCLYISIPLKKVWRYHHTTGVQYLEVNESNYMWVINCFK